ncbi:MAG: hypothetical protein EP333_02095 [Bacteroidetes bacterium]|nr:MAG: hypothetical protein EP333_02095 [Bacteroidota bacterium]TNE97672.1 MAG: hypothetical protein EP322_06270 [Bacteroidota bacterium]
MGTIAQIFESGEHAAKKGMFNNMVMLARVDGKVDEAELQLLTKIAKRLSLTAEQIREVIENPDEYPMIPPVTKEDRADRFVQFIEMVHADGNVDPSEESLIKKYGVALGFNDGEIEAIEPEIKNMFSANEKREDILAAVLEKL